MELECPICISPFDEVEVRPLVGICGHSMCESCLRPGISCSICRKEDAFRFRTVNYQLIELISKQVENLKLQEDMKKQLADALADKKSTTSIDEVDDMQGYVKCSKCEEKTSEETARICFKCSNMDIVLELDIKELYCVSCWLESEHSDHNTIIYSEVKDDLVELRRVFINNLDGNQRCNALADLIRIRSADNAKWYAEYFQNLDKMKATMDMLNGREKKIINHVDDLRNILFSFEKRGSEHICSFRYTIEQKAIVSRRDLCVSRSLVYSLVRSANHGCLSYVSLNYGTYGVRTEPPLKCSLHSARQRYTFQKFKTDFEEYSRKFKNNIGNMNVLEGLESVSGDEDACEPAPSQKEIVVFDSFRYDWVGHIVSPDESVDTFASRIQEKHNIDGRIRLYGNGHTSLEHGTLASNGIVDLSRVRVICDAQNDDCEDKDLSEEDCRL